MTGEGVGLPATEREGLFGAALASGEASFHEGLQALGDGEDVLGAACAYLNGAPSEFFEVGFVAGALGELDVRVESERER